MTAHINSSQLASRVNRSKAISAQNISAIQFDRLFASQHGVIVLSGYGLKIYLDRGHLSLEDGIGDERRKGRFSRVYHHLRRIVVIGSSGMISLDAVRWMADQKIGFTMLDRDGSTLLSVGPTALSDTRIRRAQALAQHHPFAVDIVRELIRRKLMGQITILKDKLRKQNDANLVEQYVGRLATASTIDAVRQIEAKAASVYWTAWHSVTVRFPTSESLSAPDHWQKFNTRRSVLTFNARKATNPINAILNYLYTLLESETRLAINALGLDPGFGLLHVDAVTRDSLVYDLMEPVRPRVDAYVLDWLAQTPLRKSAFIEDRDGTCRLTTAITTQLSETVAIWSRDVAPLAEWFVHELCSSLLKDQKVRGPGTRLTQQRRRESKGIPADLPSSVTMPKQQSLCTTCGEPVSEGLRYCGDCTTAASTKAILTATEASRTPEALKRRAAKMAAQCEARRNWSPADLPEWLSKQAYITRIQPLLVKMSRTTIQESLGVSAYYARGVATGKIIPHQRHWVRLAELAGVTPSGLI